MFKALSLAALLSSIIALTSFSSPAGASPGALPTPLIVAKGKLVNQTAIIPTTTIFTAPETGLYRFSVYATLTKSDATSGSGWSVNLNWTDESGFVGNYNPVLYDFSNANPGPFIFSGLGLSPSVAFEAVAGSPITYNVTQSGPADNSAYSLYYTLERLE